VCAGALLSYSLASTSLEDDVMAWRPSMQPLCLCNGAKGSTGSGGRKGARERRGHEGGVESALCATGTSYDGVVVVGSRWMWDRMQPCGLAGVGRRGGTGAEGA
jgi:hypothetical protein